MNRRKALSLVLVAAVVSIAVTGAWLWFPLPGNHNPEPTPNITLDPFNQLDWWDVAWQLASKTDYMGFLQAILSFGSRYDDTEGYTQAANWIINTLDSWSIPTIYVGAHDSLLGYQRGYGNDTRAIVFGAHLDSEEGYIGVDQNAAGCAVVITVAKILSQFRLPVDIYYCFFAGNMQFLDEQLRNRALWGSREISQHLSSQGVSVTAFYNFDELLYYDRNKDASQRVLAEYDTELGWGYHSAKYLADLMVSFMKHSGLNITSESGGQSAQTDHLPFLAAGFPSINVRSGHPYDIDNPPRDSTTDQGFNTTQAFLVARASASIAVYLSMRGNGDESRQRLQGAILPYSNRSMQAVMTVTQPLHFWGSISNGSKLALTVIADGIIPLNDTLLPMENFSFITPSSAPLGLLTVTVLNTANSTSTITLYLEYVSDTDGNGILDSVQYYWPAPVPPLDWDRDGLPDSDEIASRTDVFRPDTDNDGMGDAFEVRYGLNPFLDDSREDPDSDGLASIQEATIRTNPMNNDTDNDTMPDGWEVAWGLSPLVDDSGLDPDSDTLTNVQEYQYRSDPLSSDGDHDGVPDKMEVDKGMNPLNSDTDNDLLRDQLELLENLNPSYPDSDYDLLVDGADSNPHINNIAVGVLLVLLPFVVGSILIERRVKG